MTIYIYSNWKMNFTQDEAHQFGYRLTEAIGHLSKQIEVILFPGNALLTTVSKAIRNSAYIGLGAQNVHWECGGSFTGETSLRMLPDLCTHVLVGHSERREHFGDTEAIINRKTVRIIEGGLKAVLCVGESDPSPSDESVEDVIGAQISSALGNLKSGFGQNLMIAYEPVWAVGSNLPATPEMVNSRAKFIKGFTKQLDYVENSESVPVIYGGSVTLENVGAYLELESVDGVLLGGASLSVESFKQVIRVAEDY